MIYDSQMLPIEDALDTLLAEIEASESCQEFLLKRQEFTENQEAQKLRQEFIRQREKLAAISEYRQYISGFSEQQQALMATKRRLDLNFQVAEYRQKETNLQDLLDEIVNSVAKKIDATVKVEGGNPFFETGQHSCGGNCHEC